MTEYNFICEFKEKLVFVIASKINSMQRTSAVFIGKCRKIGSVFECMTTAAEYYAPLKQAILG
jgi:hypothetical protein